MKEIGVDKKYMNGYLLITNSIRDLKLNALTAKNGFYVKVIPIAFLVASRNWESYSEHIDRILSGPVKEGKEMMRRALEEKFGEDIIPELLSLEELLYLLLKLSKDLALEKS